MTITMKIYLS